MKSEYSSIIKKIIELNKKINGLIAEVNEITTTAKNIKQKQPTK